MTPAELRTITHSTLRVLADSRRLEDIIIVGNIVARPRMEQLALELRRTREGAALLDERPEMTTKHVDLERLRRLAPETLGRTFVDHLDRHGLDIDALSSPPPDPSDPDHVYLLRRVRGSHDLWHALLGMGIAGHEEVLVHAFTYGQLRVAHSLMILVFGGLKHLVLERRWRLLTRDLYRYLDAGRRAAPLLTVRWEDHWDVPLARIREAYRLPS